MLGPGREGTVVPHRAGRVNGLLEVPAANKSRGLHIEHRAVTANNASEWCALGDLFGSQRTGVQALTPPRRRSGRGPHGGEDLEEKYPRHSPNVY